jgi:hypothetical protein
VADSLNLKDISMSDFAFINSVCTEVLALRKNYIHRFAVSEIASSIGALREDALPEIKQILSRHRRELNIGKPVSAACRGRLVTIRPPRLSSFRCRVPPSEATAKRPSNTSLTAAES